MKDLISQLQLRGDEKILDVGCGDGRLTVEISKYLPQGYIIGRPHRPRCAAIVRAGGANDPWTNPDATQCERTLCLLSLCLLS